MFERTLILLLALCMAGGCSVFRKQESGNFPVSGEETSSLALEDIVNQNVTTNSFFISKADVEISGMGIKDKFIASIKYNIDGEYLISLRSRSGIEGARIYISKDTVLINDRINRKLYYGSGEQLSGKYGFSPSLIPVILGDYIAYDYLTGKKEKCVNGEFLSYQVLKGTDIEYTLNCGKHKVISATTGKGRGIKLQFSEFLNLNDKKVAGAIEFVDIAREIKLSIIIRKIESPWEGEINFIPGSGYEHIPLI